MPTASQQRNGRRPGYRPQDSTEPAPDSLVEVELALERGPVTFPIVMRARYLGSRELYGRAVAAFAEEHGGVRESFYANRFPAGAMLTEQGELFLDTWWEGREVDPMARELEAEISDLRMRAKSYVPADRRPAFMQQLLRLYRGLVTAADPKQLRRELSIAQKDYRVAAAAHGGRKYVAGAAGGVMLIAVVAIGLALGLSTADRTIWAGVLASGAAGALLSVLERSTRDALHVRFEAGRVWLSGVYQPAVGALSALALFALVEGGIVPLDPPAAATERALFFAGLGFLAGFTERFAKDVLGSAAGTIRPAAATRSS
jgi:hypothetical protein